MSILSAAELAAVRARYSRKGPANAYYQPPGEVMFADCLALLAHADALEEQGSKLTREMNLKLDEIERLTAQVAALTAQNEKLRDFVDDASREAEVYRPTSGPPHLDPRKHDRPADPTNQLADSKPIHDAHLANDHQLCSAEWCAYGVRPQPTVEAGIAAEDTSPDAIDAELNGHEPTAFADGGAL